MTSFAIRAVLIVVISIGLLFAAMFVVILPSLENAILEQKREMIRELTNSAWNIMARHEQDAAAGLISSDEARKRSIEQLRSLHYGQQMKDYFWVNDLHPRMIVHPYRTDLENKDLREFRDPDGKRIFVEMAEIVKNSGSGYLQYRWQWKDDPNRIVEKLSFVKGFKPWGWVIGTGVYIDDVQKEIQTARHKLLILSLVVMLAVLILLGLLLWDSITTDRKRLKAETALQKSEEKYRKLVESSGECLLLQIGQDSLYANQSMLHLLESSWEELVSRQLKDIFAPTPEEIASGQRYFQRFLAGEPVPAIFETLLTTGSGKTRNVTVSFSRISIKDQQGLVIVANDVSQQRQKEAMQEAFLREAQAGNRFWEKPTAEAADTDFKLVTSGQLLDFVESGDKYWILARENNFFTIHSEEILGQLQKGKDLSSSFITCEWHKSQQIYGSAPVWQALSVLQNDYFRPLVVVDSNQKPIGVISANDLARISSFSPHLLRVELEAAENETELAKANRRFFEWLIYLVRSGIKSSMINRMMSDNTDLVVRMAVKLAQNEAGPSPVAWGFFVLGSGARQEQTLCTDQDNAIIFSDVAPEILEKTRAYFLQLGQEVCRTLSLCGYRECEGGFMANQAKWCLTKSEWQNTYEKWLKTSEAEDLLHAKIFFDVRTVAGEDGLLQDLLTYIDGKLRELPGFFFLLARNVLLFQPPISFMGNFVADPDVKDREVLNIKGIMALLSDFARIYALKHNFKCNHSCERFQAMAQQEILTGESHAEIKRMFDFLMSMRLEHQAGLLFRGQTADNYIEPAALSALDQSALKEILSQIKNYQVRLSYDFTGSMHQQV